MLRTRPSWPSSCGTSTTPALFLRRTLRRRSTPGANGRRELAGDDSGRFSSARLHAKLTSGRVPTVRFFYACFHIKLDYDKTLRKDSFSGAFLVKTFALISFAALVALCMSTSQAETIRLAADPALSPDGQTLAFSWRGD